jgi:ATP-binding cassette, subfamily C, bacterial
MEKRPDPLPTGRARTPFLLQMEGVECGAAALGMMLSYYKRIVPLATLRRDCGVSRDGSSVSNVLKAGRSYGLTAKAFKKDVSGLKDFRYPFIVFWNFNHFLVVEGYKNGKVFLNDPATGPRSVSFEEFDESFTGVVLVMEPGPDFKRGGRKPSMLLSLWDRLRGSLAPVLFAIFTALLLVIPGIITPALVQTFVDKVLVQGFRDWGRPLVLGMLLAALLKAFLSSLQLRVLRLLQFRLTIAMSGGFVWRLLRLPASFYAQRFPGEISSRVVMNERVANVLSGKLATTAVDVLMMIFYIAVMVQFNVALTAIAVLFALMNFGMLSWVSRSRVESNQRTASQQGKLTGVGIAGLQGIRTLKASGLESDFYARWSGTFANFAVSLQEGGERNYVFGALPALLNSVMTGAVLVFGGFEVMNGRLSIGQLVAFQSLTLSFLAPVNSLVGLGDTLQNLEGELSRLDDVLSNPALPDTAGLDASRGVPVRLSGHVEFRNVSFGYNPVAPPLIENLSFTLAPGQRIAFVGGSGSGKSTVAKLVAGLYQPTSGTILFDGIPADQVPREIQSHSLAMVEQDILMFEGSVRDNLTLWDASAPAGDVVAACQDALIDEAIAALPEGYGSSLLEGAANLSGGQKQRLEIARALSGNPSILIMDEATSALDAETERVIDRNIRRRGASCIIVAHRLSTIRDSDEIIVLDLGKVVQRGAHAELIAQPGKYAKLLADDPSMQERTA